MVFNITVKTELNVKKNQTYHANTLSESQYCYINIRKVDFM